MPLMSPLTITNNIAYTIGSLANTTLSADIVAGAVVLPVNDSSGFADGDYMAIALDNGQLHQSTVNGAPGGGNITIHDALPGDAGTGNRVMLGVFQPLLADIEQYPTVMRLGDEANIGDNTIQLRNAPTAVAVGHYVIVDPFTNACEFRVITGIAGNVISFTETLSADHDQGDLVLMTTDPTVNVKLFGAVGDGATDDTAAIQAAMDVNLNGTDSDRRTTIYFPPGQYKITSTLDMTERRDWCIQGASRMDTQIYGVMSGGAMLEVIGARYFDIKSITFAGDGTTSPDFAIVGARTSGYPNNSTALLSEVYFTGTFNSRAVYLINSEVWKYFCCGCTALYVPYMFHIADSNSLGYTPVHATISSAYHGSTGHVFHDCWFSMAGGQDCTVWYLEKNINGFSVRDTYTATYGSGAVMEFSDDAAGILLDGIGAEGDATIFLKHTSGTISGMTMQGIGSKDVLISSASGTKIEKSTIRQVRSSAGSGGDVFAFYDVEECHIFDWRVFDNEGFTCHNLDGVFYDIGTGAITATGNISAPMVYVVAGSPRYVRIPQLYVGDSANLLVKKIYSGSTTYDPGTVANGNRVSKNVVFSGPQTGDVCVGVALSISISTNVIVTSTVYGGGVHVVFENQSGSDWSPGSMTITCVVWDIT